MKKTTVLLISPMPPAIGGIASWTRNILDYTKQHDISYLDVLDSSLKFRSVVHISSFSRILCGVLDTVRITWNLVKYCIIARPLLIHNCTSASFALFKDIMLLFVANCFNSKYVIHFHFGRIPELSLCRNWEWKLLSFLINRVHEVVVIDRYSYETLCSVCKKNNIYLLPNPCSLELNSVIQEAVHASKKNEFIFVGHVIRTKGVYEMVEAIAALPDNLNLEIIGPCGDKVRSDLLTIASIKDNARWLKIVGSQNKHYVIKKMQQASALLLPSYTEGFPNVILEAMAVGCPVIATNVGAIPDMLDVDEINLCAGICFEPKSMKSLQMALLCFLNEPSKSNLYAINGKNRVKSAYTMESVYPLLEKIWNKENKY